MKIKDYQELLLIEDTKREFENNLLKELGLVKISCPLFVQKSTGLQDQLSGCEEAVSFESNEEMFEIVHSLAKWKRSALKEYEFPKEIGICTDMKAIRREEVIDYCHSIYVDQWDWEKIIDKEERTVDTLKLYVKKIYNALYETSIYLRNKGIDAYNLNKDIYFITTQELEDLYPLLDPKLREDLITCIYKSVFIIGVGDKLKSGFSHDMRSPDYDDWKMNGDLLVYYEESGKALELSSMGIRVDKDSLLEQLEKNSCLERLTGDYHQALINEELPLTIGGGIGQSRVALFLLKKKHIKEVQVSSWPNEKVKEKTLYK